MDRKYFQKKFSQHFTGEPRIFRAPGRVNLIGEHTDYNEGYVFPMAIDRYTTVAIGVRSDRRLKIYSENMQETVTIDLNDNGEKRNHWSDYVTGVARMIELEGILLPGANIYLKSDVPVGSGLSSSAAMLISSALALLSTTNAEMDTFNLAKLGQRAENQFVGMNCGIMDQFISLHGEADHALFLDCRSLGFLQVPLPSDKAKIVVCNTMVKHELGSSEYNKRRAECEEGVRLMQGGLPDIWALRDVSSSQFAKVEQKLPEVVRKRCRHVISENERVLASIDALEQNDLSQFGRLMNASHDSLRDDYQVSCRELDVMVEIARSLPGTLGARMTGGGFGGCTVNLIESNAVDAFCKEIKRQYHQATGLDPNVYVAIPSRGAHEMA